MEKPVSSPDIEKEIEEAVMENGWVDVSDMVPADPTKEPPSASAGGDELSTTEGSIIICKVCQVSFTGITPYEQHIVGSKHKKKLIKESMKKKYGKKYLEALKSLEPKSETPMEATDTANGDDDAVVLTCDVCKKACTGIVSYKLHMKGKSHQKQLRKQTSLQKLKENPDFSLDEKANALEDSVYDVMPQVKPFAQCVSCKKKFYGPQALQDHLSSGSHKRKLEMESLSKKLTESGYSTKDESVTPSADILGGGDNFAKCSICEKNFTGPIPYQQHLISDTHKKKMKTFELAEKMKLLSVNDEKVGTFHCQDCERSFYIPEEFEQHLKSSAHTKRKTKQQMLKKLQNEYPEMEVQAVTTNRDDSLENEVHLPDNATVLICNICHKSFSGPETAFAHFTSQKHAKAKKYLSLVQQRKLEQKKEIF